MRRAVWMIIGVFVLAGFGGLCLVAARLERRLGLAQEDMAVLDFEDPEADYPRLAQEIDRWPWVSRSVLQEIGVRRATLQYWRRDYGSLAHAAVTTQPNSGQIVDPDLQLIGANAAYRSAQRGPTDKASLLKNLDAAIYAYAEALRAGNERPDAAYNYELAVRFRSEIASGKRKELPAGDNVEDESDANMHGEPGEPPKDMKVQQFQVRVPLDQNEIKKNEDQSAGLGQQRKRKG